MKRMHPYDPKCKCERCKAVAKLVIQHVPVPGRPGKATIIKYLGK